jgi:hypothetical protein
MPKPNEVANASRYDKTMNASGLDVKKSGLSPSFVAAIMERLSGHKGATKGGTARRPTYATKQAKMVARGK